MWVYILTCLAWSASFAQTNYSSQIQNARASYQNKNYIKAALIYRQAFSAYPDSVKMFDVYSSARSWALAGKADSAIIQLQTAAMRYKFNKYGMLMADPNFGSLHQREEWQPLTSQVKANMQAAYTPLQRELQGIRDNDQSYRLQADSLRKAEGPGSAKLAVVYKQIIHADSTDLEKIEKILDTRGWPPYSEIGDLYSALFLVIQHADLNTQLKYLPLIQSAADKNDIDPESLAILKDRIAIRQGRKQLYGSQVEYNPATKAYTVSPIEDEPHVNERRAKIGMPPLQEYLKQWNIVYIPVNQ